MSLPYPYTYPLSVNSQPSGNNGKMALNGDLVNTQITLSNVSGGFSAITSPKNANFIYAGPVGGAPTTPAFRALVSADLPLVNLNSNINGGVTAVLGVVNGGTGTSTQFTQGSVVFAGVGGVYSQDNSNFFWDSVNSRLGLGVGAPTYSFHLSQINKFQSFLDDSGTTKYVGSLFNNTSTNSFVPLANSLNNALEVNLDVDNSVASATWVGTSSTIGTHSGSGTCVGNFVAATLDSYHNATSTIANMYGGKSTVNNTSSGIISAASGLQTVVVNNGSGSITSAYALNVANGGGTGVIAVNNGLYINPLANTFNGTSTTGGYYSYAATMWMPFQGGNTSGINYNYGLLIQGSGGTAGVGGFVYNVGIGVASNAPSYFANWVAVNQITTTPLYPIDCAGEVAVTSVGHGFRVKEGVNAKQGTAILVAGTVVVANSNITANSRIFLTTQIPSGTVGSLFVSTRTAGTSFTVTSTSALDNSTVAYFITEPA